MNFREQMFRDFKQQFGGIFFNMLPDETPVYVYNKNTYLLTDNTKDLIKKSLNDKINYLLNNNKFIDNPYVLH